MGFGALFVGYLLLFICKGVDIFPDTVAYALMLYAIIKLASYNDSFIRAKYVLMTAIPIAVIGDVIHIAAAVKKSSANAFDLGYFGIAVSAIMSVILIAFHYFLLKAIRILALEVKLPKIADRATGNWALTIIYFSVSLILQLKLPFLEEFTLYFSLPVVLFGLVWIAINAILIFSCYMRICLEGDEDMPDKKENHK